MTPIISHPCRKITTSDLISLHLPDYTKPKHSKREILRWLIQNTSDRGDDHHSPGDELVMEVSVCVGGTIRRNQQIGSVKIRGVDRGKLDLHRPLSQLACYRGGCWHAAAHAPQPLHFSASILIIFLIISFPPVMLFLDFLRLL